MGSGHYVQNAIPAWEQVDGVLNMEMIGYYSDEPGSQTLPDGFEFLFPDAVAALEADEYRGDFLTIVGNTASQALVDSSLSAIAQFVPDLDLIPLVVPGNGEIAPDLRRSDHREFWDAGMQALMFTDASEFRNPNYHTPNDVPDSLDMAFLTRCTKAVLATAALMAEPVHAGSATFTLSDAMGIRAPGAAFPCLAEVYPNPARAVVKFRLGACHGTDVFVKLYDAKGQLVIQRALHPALGSASYALPLKAHARGTYLLVLESDGATSTLKVEVE